MKACIMNSSKFLARYRWHLLLASTAAVVLLFISVTHFNMSGDLEGIYLLSCDRGLLFDLDDDIYLGDEHRVIFHVDFTGIKEYLRHDNSWLARYLDDPETEELRLRWSEKRGRGYVLSFLPGGGRVLTCFGKYRDSDGQVSRGLFVGGGVPPSVHKALEVTMNATGMAYYNGREWHHLWCTANEAISPAYSFRKTGLSPSAWKFLGSTVLEESEEKVVLKSSHEIDLPELRLHIDRYAFFRSGDAYFILAVVVRNSGPAWANYYYTYGDEPWVGEYGSSIGNVGWVKDRLFPYEGKVDTSRYFFIGMYDKGNKAVPGEQGVFTGVANFIEWLGENKPDLVYFSNRIGSYSPESEKVPLADAVNRVLFLQWGPQSLGPDRAKTYLFAIGMAGIDTVTGFPVKPDVVFSSEDRKYLEQP